MNIRFIFATTSISFFFGSYSIYNIFNYLMEIKKTQNDKNVEITNIINDKYQHLCGEFQELNKKFDDLVIENEITKNIINSLSQKIDVLNSKVNTIASDDQDSTETETMTYDFKDVPQVFMENEKSIFEDENLKDSFLSESIIISKFADNSHKKIIPLYNSQDNIYRPRSTTNPEINWLSTTKKFIFG